MKKIAEIERQMARVAEAKRQAKEELRKRTNQIMSNEDKARLTAIIFSCNVGYPFVKKWEVETLYKVIKEVTLEALNADDMMRDKQKHRPVNKRASF